MSENIFPVAQSGSTESPKKSFRIRKKFSLIFFLSLFIVFTFIFADNFSKEWEVEVTQAVIYPLSQNNLSDKNDSIKTSSEVLFQASGWIEPDPFPIRVTSLYSGVVKKSSCPGRTKSNKGSNYCIACRRRCSSCSF